VEALGAEGGGGGLKDRGALLIGQLGTRRSHDPDVAPGSTKVNYTV
jgi:hypothetical protein